MPPEDRPEAGSAEHWLRHAKSDLRAGVVLRADSAVLSEKACFHFQQAAEKGLKGVLILRGVDFPWVHDINRLVKALAESGVRVPRRVRESELLTPYAVQTRYPADLPDIPDEEVEEAEQAAAAVVTWAETKITPRRRRSAGKRTTSGR